MKLCRYGPVGEERPGIVDADGAIRDLSSIVPDIGGDTLSADGLSRLRAVAVDQLPRVAGDVRYGVPVHGTRKFIAIGLNYADHAAESNLPIPSEPVVFSKWVNCLQGANDPVIIPPGSEKTDWEVELGVVIGTLGGRARRGDRNARLSG